MSRVERVKAEFVVTDAERAQLLRWSHGESARLAVRAKIVLGCAEPGVVYERLAAELGVTTMTVGAWRKRFARARCDGLADGRRSGRPKAELVVTDAEREQLTRWSRRAEAPPELAAAGENGRGFADGGPDTQGTAPRRGAPGTQH